MMTLAMLPRLRGRRQMAAEKMQKRAACLIAECIQARQREWLARLLANARSGADRAEATTFSISFAFDEAQQRMRSMVDKMPAMNCGIRATAMPVASSVMVALCRVCLASCRQGSSNERCSEPWVCPLRYLTKSNANCLLQGVLRSYPIDLESPQTFRELGTLFCFVWLAWSVDSAAANLSAMRWVMDIVMNDAPPNVGMHCQACCSHQVHILKTKCVDIAGIAGNLYSTSKLLRLNSSLNGVRDGLHDCLAKDMDLVFEPGPESVEGHPFMQACQAIFGCDGDLSFLHIMRGGGGRGLPLFCATCKPLASGSRSTGRPGGGSITHGAMRNTKRQCKLGGLLRKSVGRTRSAMLPLYYRTCSWDIRGRSQRCPGGPMWSRP